MGRFKYKKIFIYFFVDKESLAQELSSLIIIGLGYDAQNQTSCQDSHCVKSAQIRSFFWFAFSCIQSEYRNIFLYSVRIQEKTDQKKTLYLNTFHAVSAEHFMI